MLVVDLASDRGSIPRASTETLSHPMPHRLPKTVRYCFSPVNAALPNSRGGNTAQAAGGAPGGIGDAERGAAQWLGVSAVTTGLRTAPFAPSWPMPRRAPLPRRRSTRADLPRAGQTGVNLISALKRIGFVELLLHFQVGQHVRRRIRQLGDAAGAGRRHDDTVRRVG